MEMWKVRTNPFYRMRKAPKLSSISKTKVLPNYHEDSRRRLRKHQRCTGKYPEQILTRPPPFLGNRETTINKSGDLKLRHHPYMSPKTTLALLLACPVTRSRPASS